MFLSSVLLFSALLPRSAHAAPQGSYGASNCKPMPGDPHWPSDSDWASLNKSVSGKLLAPVPPASVCFPSPGKFVLPAQSAACAEVAASWDNSTYHAAHPFSHDWPLYQDDACLPTDLYNKSDATCDFTRFPKYVIDADTVEDVQAGVKFAAKTGVRLVVRATGHDFLGRSTAPGSLVIRTRNILGLQYVPSFTPEKCAKSSLAGKPALTIAAGHVMRELYAFSKQYGVTPVAGADKNVGIGGWMSGGGHSFISADFGLGVDSVIEMKVVIPSGDYVTANECENPDLFWALRGGGGGTYGVMMSITTVAYKDDPFCLIQLGFNSTMEEATERNNDAYYEFLEYLFNYLPTLSDASFGGYTSMGKIIPGPIGTSPYSANPSFYTLPTLDAVEETTPRQHYYSMTIGRFNTTPEEIQTIVQPLLDKFQTYNGSLEGYFYPEPHPSYGDYRDMIPFGGVGVNTILSSRLWPKEAFTAPGLQDTLRTITNPGLQLLMVSGPNVRNKPGDSVSALPAWRKAYGHAITPLTTAWKDPAQKAKSIAHINNVWLPALKSRAPDSGSYIAESTNFQPDWQHEFWGSNYPRLQGIKKKLDPKGVFYCSACVGAEDWKEDSSGRVCKA